MEVTLEQMLDAREQRAFRQFRLSREYAMTLVSFSMNIPGPVKDSPLIRRGFLRGCRGLDAALPAEQVRFREILPAVTGWEAVYVLDMPAPAVKTITTALEDSCPLGRLWDMDVLDPSLAKLDRELVGGKSRNCIVCGLPGKGCASRRVHSIGELQGAVNRILRDHFAREDAQWVASLAVKSLLEEVSTTPKPGLVDLRNTGSHRDMDQSTFTASANALLPYFTGCVLTGMETANLPPEETFPRLRSAGLEAEAAMYAATGGVNTHKGAIFTMGLLCGAAGRLWVPDAGWAEAPLLQEVSAMTRKAMDADFSALQAATAGEQLYASHGIRGIRGEAAQGFPSLSGTGLPALRRYLDQGLDRNLAGVLILLHLISQVEDTCLIHRGGSDLAREAAGKAAALLQAAPVIREVEALDDWFIERNLSPGGCADLLAASYFLYDLCGAARQREAAI